jgi:hypothetical protein
MAVLILDARVNDVVAGRVSSLLYDSALELNAPSELVHRLRALSLKRRRSTDRPREC